MSAAPAAAPADSLYAAHEKVYPREIDGRYARLRRLTAWVLLGLFYAVAWLRWNGRQATTRGR